MKKYSTKRKVKEKEFTQEEVEAGFDYLSIEEKGRVLVYLDIIHLCKNRLKDLVRKCQQDTQTKYYEGLEAACRYVLDEKLKPEEALLMIRERGYTTVSLEAIRKYARLVNSEMEGN